MEAILKLISFGYSYFNSGWNQFDFTILIISIIGVILDFTLNFQMGSSTSVLRSLRIIRVSRLLNKFKSLNIIFHTFIATLPALANIGSLLMLGLYIFAIIGRNNYAFLKNGEAINDHANFRSFVNSFMILFRVSTGENWDIILNDSVSFQKPNFICFKINNYNDYQLYGKINYIKY